MFPADGGDEAVPHEVIAQGGQRPTPPRETEIAGGLVGQAPNRAVMSGCQLRVWAHPPFLAQGLHTVLLKGMQIGPDGVHMHLQEPGDVRGPVPGCKE